MIDGGAELYFLEFGRIDGDACRPKKYIAGAVPAAEIVENFGDAPMPIAGDAKLLFQVFSNLPPTASSIPTSGGAILVEAAVIANEAVVSVTDRGIGIPQAISTGCSSAIIAATMLGIVGTGVGLYLVKTAVDLHKGRIEIASEEGSGSRFVVRLPIESVLRRQSQKKLEPRTAPDAPSIVSPSTA